MLSQKIFEILCCVMAFLPGVLFEQILIKLFASHSESFSKQHDAFCSHIFDLCTLASGQARSGSKKFWWGDAILS